MSRVLLSIYNTLHYSKERPAFQLWSFRILDSASLTFLSEASIILVNEETSANVIVNFVYGGNGIFLFKTRSTQVCSRKRQISPFRWLLLRRTPLPALFEDWSERVHKNSVYLVPRYRSDCPRVSPDSISVQTFRCNRHCVQLFRLDDSRTHLLIHPAPANISGRQKF